MEEVRDSNRVCLRGTVSEAPVFSHESRGERFYRFSLDVERLSGAVDSVHILARGQLLEALTLPEAGDGEKLCVEGELRTFNNKSGVGARLVISVFARALRFENGPDLNDVVLAGALCKLPNYRTTPMGREICDLMLAVNRRYGRSDYLPCIAWGAAAREAALWQVGDAVSLNGRIQSRRYSKTVDGQTLEKTAYEVSVIGIRREFPE